ncbi:hypothetical protein LOC68_05515 [Blastopirellula sp. JC732]|uniref:Uncharacterized protein n=1 Tax=Blastopirellula sediminis TaxID=2894196 RepID=A0A9X1MJE8_9BACT|nr:hypothetical protein [Blastopirellula sediminis]MCC9609377.1 hypothetical protein [Blastopirellula sediminis]MCC9627846.1 hypothetical protein [Blastopirellula sediminis]
MGHTRLGALPRTRAWRDVVQLIAAGADTAQVAEATIRAAEKSFSFVQDDCGYNHAVWLLTQLGLAGRSSDPVGYLREHGVNIPENSSITEVVVGLSEALDNATYQEITRSDLGDLAQRALCDAVVTRMEPKLQQQSLFDTRADDIKAALSDFSKEKEFAHLSREFYSRLTCESMNYFLSRTLATHLGDGQRFATMNQMAEFDNALETHCREASKIVEQYSGEWFSLHVYQEHGAISRDSVQGFASWALKKINDELRVGANANGH